MRKLVAEVLTAWRRAERLERSLPVGTPEHAAARRACERLREAYQDLVRSGVVAPLSEEEARDLVSDVAEDLRVPEPDRSSGSPAPV